MLKNANGVLIVSLTSMGIVNDENADFIVTYRKAMVTSKPMIRVNPCV